MLVNILPADVSAKHTEGNILSSKLQKTQVIVCILQLKSRGKTN